MRLRAITISILVEQYFNMNSSNVAVPVARAALIVLLPGDLSLVVGKP